MAYKKEDLIKKSLKAIETNELVFIDEIFIYVDFGKTTFYSHKLNETDELKEAIEINRVARKSVLRDKWLLSDNATLQVALYKLLSTPEEFAKLATNKLEHKVEDKPEIIFTFDKPKEEEVENE